MKKKRIWFGLLAIVLILGLFFFGLVLIVRLSGTPSHLSFGDKIAIVEIRGVITQSSSVIEEIHHHLADDSVKAIILRIDSPGGGVGPSQEIHREVVRAKEKNKKIITSMGAVAASGGYYVACASDLIVANPGTITGSIGVVMQFSNFEELLKKIGVKGIVVKSGEYKDIGSPFREMTPEEKKIMQESLDNVHQQFIRAVADGRNLDPAKVLPIADGRIMTGEQAKQLGLVDKLGNLDDAIEEAAKLVGIEGRPHVLYPKKKFTLWELLMKGMVSAVIEALNEKGFELNYRLLFPVD